MALITTKFIADNAVTGPKIRLANASWLRSRNAANSADINILEVDSSDVIQFGSVPQVPSDPVATSDLSNKNYVDQVVSNLLDKMRTEFFSLSSGDISNGYIDLANAAFDDSVEVMAGGVGQIVGVDYSLSLPTAVTRVTFLSPLTSILAAGDEIIVNYNVSATISNAGPVVVNLLKEVAVINDSKSSGTNGGTFTSGSWQTRDLNTVQASQPWLSLSANQFSLEAGTYEIRAKAPALEVDHHVAKLYDITNSADAIIGTSEYCSTADGVVASSFVIGTINPTSKTTYEIRHRCQTTQASAGFGANANFSVPEVYTDVEITKLNPVSKDVFIGPVESGTSAVNSSTSYATFSTSPTLIFTPNVSGAYKVYSSVPLYESAPAQSANARIFNTSGNATLVSELSAVIYASPSDNTINSSFVQSIYNLTAGISYSFDVQGKVSGGAGCYLECSGSQYLIIAEKLGAVIGGALTTPQTFFASSQVTTNSGAITNSSFVTFNNSPAFSITPDVSGTYKVYSSFGLTQTSSANAYTVCRIVNTSGGASILYESQCSGTATNGIDGAGAVSIQSVFALTAGTAYVFDIQGRTNGSITNRGDLGPFYMFAEKVG